MQPTVLPEKNDNRPRVYCQREDIDALRPWVTNEQQRFKAVAYEWPEDGVFHLYAKKPKYRPGSHPVGGFLVFVDNVFELKESSAHLQQGLYERLCKEGAGKRFIVAFFALNHAANDRRVFLCEPDGNIECASEDIPPPEELYSRHKGLLEVDDLAEKCIGIIGLGSFGSTIAIELSKAGLGSFMLFDPDRLELANVSRHVCGISDLGRLKTNAVSDAILQKNPYAGIEKYPVDIVEEKQLFEANASRCDLLIAVTDENQSRFTINEIALKQNIPCLFGRAITRAAGGDVFRLKAGGNPCLSCQIEQGILKGDEEVSGERQAKRNAPAYMTNEQVKATIQVGLSADIAPITQMIVKLALVELSDSADPVFQNLQEDLTADYYIWANRRELIYEEWQSMGANFNRPSILRWYGVNVPRSLECLSCQRDLE